VFAIEHLEFRSIINFAHQLYRYGIFLRMDNEHRGRLSETDGKVRIVLDQIFKRLNGHSVLEVGGDRWMCFHIEL
jgi:hypothetical protein